MDFLRIVVRLVFLLQFICKLGGCYKVRYTGKLTVDKNIIPLGSNLTVHCRSNTEQCNRSFIIQLNEQTIVEKISCSSVTTQIVVREPKFSLRCLERQGDRLHFVCGRDIVADLIPNTPHIKQIQFRKGSLSASIHWQSPDDMDLLEPRLRFRKTFGAQGWMAGNVIQLQREQLLMLDALEPLTSYQFELKVCTASLKHNCSLWSQNVNQRSPGQAPINKLDVWRVITRNEGTSTQNVTVFWKAFTSEDYKGDLLGYELVYKENNTIHTLNCSATANQYTLHLPLEVMEVNVSAVTSAGNSPPAPVRLIYTGRPTPIRYIIQAAEGTIHLTWNSSQLLYNNTEEQVLGFVVEWRCSSMDVHWKRIGKNQNTTFIDGKPSCPAYVSLYVESIKGVFRHIDWKIKKTTTDPRPINNNKTGHKSNLKTPRTMSAANLAAEGPEEWMIIVICLMTALPIVIIINMMYLKCARQRIRKACISMGPSWLFENLPKLGNSNAIKLLQDEKCGSNLCWQPVDSDPPLSPIEDFSPPMERRDSYPIVHKEDTIEERKVVKDWANCPYKPQISIVSQRMETVSETSEKDEDEHPWVVFSPGFNSCDEEFFPSQRINGLLSTSLTVDGTPVSMDAINGILFLSQTTLSKDTWNVAGDKTFTETGNGDKHPYQGQTVLPNDLARNFKEPAFKARTQSSQGASRALHTQTVLCTLQLEEHLL